MKSYNHKKIEKDWQKYWSEHLELSEAQENSAKPKFYCLDMFPYPSGAGLHVGHVENYTATDIYSRFKRMNGFNVLHPIGWDAFGLPAENYAIKKGVHPDKSTHDNIKNFINQIKNIGISYDWSREIDTSSPEYYKWTQWFFLFLYKNGLAYKKKAKANWCESCKTVVANEQVVDGKCERCGGEIIQKDLEQWFFKITDFVEDTDGENGKISGLINGLDKIDWPNSTKIAQKNWIGKSEGTIVKFQIKDSGKNVEVFTTRVDTIFGCTYVVLAPESKLVSELKEQVKNKEEVEKYIIDTKKKTDLERMENKEKTGVEMKGIKAINPFNNEEVPVFVADYVIATYGTGAVMAVPAHDERDFEFAKKYDLPIRQSIVQVLETNGIDKVREDKETIERKSVDVIMKHWKEDAYFCLDWKYNNWKSFIIGGVEEGENIEEAALREAREESGYKNMKVVRQVGGEIHSNFFAVHKDVNRYAIRNCVYVELIDGEQEKLSEEHTKNHTGLWIKKEKVAEFINLEAPKIYWDTFLNGDRATTEDGVVIDSGEFSGLSSEEAREKMTVWLEESKSGERKINYRLRDWLVSRQRYWGAPIPIIYCEKCGEVPVPEKDLPVKLPTDVDFKPTGESPLAISKSFHDVACPLCGGESRRESDTMDTFVCSSWYYLRFADPKNEKEFAAKKNLEKWLPVDLYMGGAEHTVLHLLYARFFTKALAKYGYVNFDEPFLKLRHQGMIMAEDGRKMSKSLGNVVNPDDVVENFGADALRIYEMFMGPIDEMKAWSMQNVNGPKNFLDKVWKIFGEKELIDCGNGCEGISKELPIMLHKTIKKVTNDIEGFNFNTAISQMMIFINEFGKHDKLPKAAMEKFLILLSPFAPHMAEEIWQNVLEHKNSIFLEKWPEFDEAMTKDEEVEMVVQVNGKIRDRIKINAEISEEEAKKIALESEKVKLYTEGKEIRKVIFVKGKLVSVVI
ncbi:MAG: class I tRNA ligase family protein [Candidatus Moranbacteria bacterium]|jgi:leucyl-tRNA synthetase|nr:class I tRNA ligase family protein [Candidatus Moranbacteria bacterium]